MGNSTQCGFLSNTDSSIQFIADQNHFLYGKIKHYMRTKGENQQIAIKKLKFDSQTQYEQFKQFIHHYQEYSQVLPLIKAFEYKSVSQNVKAQNNKLQSNQKQNISSFFQCKTQGFIFKSKTQELTTSCSSPQFFITIGMQYIQKQFNLKSILSQKAFTLKKCLQNSKINQNILIQLQNKVKLCEYDKIDNLPHKQRTIINIFFNQIQVLRLLDYMISSLYGFKIYNTTTSAVRPQFFIKNGIRQKIQYFYPQLINAKNMGNFQKSLQNLQKWFDEQKALFHHNWSQKQRQLITYLHPQMLQSLTSILLSSKQSNFYDANIKLSKSQIQKHNIFALGLILIQICLLEPDICSKVYQISTFKQQKNLNNKKQMKLSQQKQNLTIKFNPNIVKKYLAQTKKRYSEQFTLLIENMIFGTLQKENSYTNLKKYETYEDVIQKISELIYVNAQNLKTVYNFSQRTKSLSKNGSQKNSRKSSLSRQVSVSGVTNPSLSSSSSISMFPSQSQQKILSLQLLRKNCKRIQNKAEQILIKSQFEVLREQRFNKEQNFQKYMLKDQQRILGQLNKISNQTVKNKNTGRFNYRRTQQNKNQIQNQSKQSQHLNLSNFNCNRSQLNTDISKIDFKLNGQSQIKQKERRVNSTAKTKKMKILKARQQQAMGSSECRTIYISSFSHLNQQQQLGYKIDSSKINKNIQQNNFVNFQGSIEPFSQQTNQNMSNKSQLKSLMLNKIKSKQSISPSNGENHSPKQLKSKQLYEIYLNEYKNLANFQAQQSS